MKPVAFLEEVWGDEEAFVDLPSKVNGRWVSGVLEWPANGAASRRIRSSVRDDEDIYFSPATFKLARRDAEAVRPTHWLWADLDEAHPDALELHGLTPTVCWRSSPGRYQALWRLDRRLSPQVHEALNRALTYAVGADKGGWDLTQVLRIPGTKNFKYTGPGGVRGVPVKLLWRDGPLYNPKALWKHLKATGRAVEPPPDRIGGSPPKPLKRGKLSRRAKRLLETPSDQVVQGERSARLWELECLLLEAGHTEEETYSLIWPCAWNKWREVRTGGPRLKREISKAARHVRGRIERLQAVREAQTSKEIREQEPHTVVEPDPPEERLPLVNYADFMAKKIEAPSWLIEDIWTAHSHGFIAGEPKGSKSTLALAMGMSVASGKPFLGKYKVHGQGPVIVVQEENDPVDVQDKLRKIAVHLGLIHRGELDIRKAPRGSLGRHEMRVKMPDDVPFHLLNNWGFDMADEGHREMLEREIDRHRPALVVLDPLYLLIGGANPDRMQDVVPYLKWLLYLRFEYNCAVVVVHHYRKQQAQGPAVRSGQRLMGSAMFHGWLASALYSEPQEDPRDSYVRTVVSREFRAMPPMKPLEVSIKMGKPGSLVFEPEVGEFDLGAQVVTLVESTPGISVSALAEQLGVDKRTALSRARGTGKIVVQSGGRGRGNTGKLWPVGHEKLSKSKKQVDRREKKRGS